jgi:hypothetical protein
VAFACALEKFSWGCNPLFAVKMVNEGGATQVGDRLVQCGLSGRF